MCISLPRLLPTALGALLVVCVMSAAAATNRVADSGVAVLTFPVTANDLKPPQCAGLNLTSLALATPGQRLNGGGGAALLLGTSNADDIRAQQGNDCVVGGAGDDILHGNGGEDVILGGPGDDIILGDNGADTLYGGDGHDQLDGGNQSDTLYGEAGNDTLDGGLHADTCRDLLGANSFIACEAFP